MVRWTIRAVPITPEYELVHDEKVAFGIRVARAFAITVGATIGASRMADIRPKAGIPAGK
jgi:hypothetical protein